MPPVLQEFPLLSLNHLHKEVVAPWPQRQGAMMLWALIEIHHLYTFNQHTCWFNNEGNYTHTHTHSYSREGCFQRNVPPFAYSNSQTCHKPLSLVTSSSTSEAGNSLWREGGDWYLVELWWCFTSKWLGTLLEGGVLLLKRKMSPKWENDHLLLCLGKNVLT